MYTENSEFLFPGVKGLLVLHVVFVLRIAVALQTYHLLCYQDAKEVRCVFLIGFLSPCLVCALQAEFFDTTTIRVLCMLKGLCHGDFADFCPKLS